MVRQLFHVREGDIGDRHGAQVGVADVERARAKAEPAPFAAYVAELLERQQDAPGGRSGEAGAARDVAEGELRRLARERGEHGEAALQRLHVIGPGLSHLTPPAGSDSLSPVRYAV